MGNIQPRSELPEKKGFHLLDYGYCIVWKRRTDCVQTMEQYQLSIQSEQRLKLFENSWPLRTNHNIFVNVYYFSHQKAINFCGEVARGSIFTQRIPYRLSEFAKVKYPEIMFIMKNCIEGYSVLYQHYGLFIIRSTMIGFTENFQTKIWMHTDFSEPEPENPNCKNLHEMLASLVSSVETACEYLNYNCPRFSEFMVETNYIYFSKDFDWLLKGLEIYMKIFQIAVVKNLTGLKGFMKQPEGWEKFKAKKPYPIRIPTYTEIQSARTIAESPQFIESAKIHTPESYFLKKEVNQPALSQRPTTPSLSRTYSHRQFENQTNNGGAFELFVVENEKIKLKKPIQKTNNYPPNAQGQYTMRPQTSSQKDELKFWRSSQKVNLNQPKANSSLLTSDNSSPSLSRFQSPPHKINFGKQAASEYYGDSMKKNKQLPSKRTSEVKSNEEVNLSRKSYDVSTDTRNRDKSLKDDFSLIEDLEVAARNQMPLNHLKHN